MCQNHASNKGDRRVSGAVSEGGRQSASWCERGDVQSRKKRPPLSDGADGLQFGALRCRERWQPAEAAPAGGERPVSAARPKRLFDLIQSRRQCLATEVLKLSGQMAAVQWEVLPSLSGEHPEAERCVRSLQDCLDLVQLPWTPLCCQLSQQLDLPCQHQVKINPPSHIYRAQR